MNFLEHVRGIEGWLTDSEAELLFDLARKAKLGVLEIGAWKGKSTSVLALGSLQGNNVPVVTIDLFEGLIADDKIDDKVFEDYLKNIEKLPREAKKLVETIKGNSHKSFNKIKDKQFDVLFIDGSHKFLDVLKDFAYYYDKVSDDGLISFHDFGTWQGSTAVGETLTKFFTEYWVVDSIIVFKKNSYSCGNEIK